MTPAANPPHANHGPLAMTFGLMMSLPFLFPYHALPMTSFGAEALALLFALLGTGVCIRSAGQMPIQLPAVIIVPLALAGVILLQMLVGMSAFPRNGVLVIAVLVWAALLAMAGRSAADKFGKSALSTLLAWCVLCGGLAGAMAGLAQYLSLPYAGALVIALPHADEGIYGNLAQQNHFATHIALAFASACWLRMERQLAMPGFAAVSLLLLPALVLSGSRSSILYLVWIGVLGLSLGRRPRDIVKFLALVVLLVLALWGAAHLSLLGPQLTRLTRFGEGAGPRLFLWGHAIQMFLAHPVLGVGFDGFATALIGQLRDGERIWGIDRYAHNLGLQLLAVTGLLGFGAVFVPVGLLLRRLLKADAQRENLWAWCMLGILFIHSMLEQPLYYAYFLGIAAFVAGMIDTRAWSIRLTRKSSVLAMIALCIMLAGLIKTANDVRLISKAFYGPGRGDTSDEPHTALIRQLHATSLLAPLTEVITPQVFISNEAPLQEKFQLNTRLMRYAPVAPVVFRQAVLLAQAGQIVQAKAQFDQAALAYPDEARKTGANISMLAGHDPASYAELDAHVREWLTRH